MKKLVVNGKEKDFATSATLTDLISQITKDPRHVIAELNGQIIKNTEWPRTRLFDGDKIELVTFVGGG